MVTLEEKPSDLSTSYLEGIIVEALAVVSEDTLRRATRDRDDQREP